jgi:hypothetical protein
VKKIKTGGPAFARPCSVDRRLHTVIPEQDGMTLRDYFAGQALAGMKNRAGTEEVHAEIAYKTADAMLKAREATDEKGS